MTSKVYKTAQGKSVDLGTIMLQNEHTRAVGNMKVNARGDKLDSNNRVIETKSRQIQKQNDRTTTNVSAAPVHASSKKTREAKTTVVAPKPTTIPAPAPVIEGVKLDPGQRPADGGKRHRKTTRKRRRAHRAQTKRRRSHAKI